MNIGNKKYAKILVVGAGAKLLAVPVKKDHITYRKTTDSSLGNSQPIQYFDEIPLPRRD